MHATCVALAGAGVLLLGKPGAGKSDLALRLIDQAGTGISGALKEARLVADDQVRVRLAGSRLMASAPAAIAGRLEIRGLGIVTVASAGEVPLVLAVLLDGPAPERLPEAEHRIILGTGLPQVRVDPRLASAPARIRAALDWLCGR
jgi:HPr kinase/phosphorylase